MDENKNKKFRNIQVHNHTLKHFFTLNFNASFSYGNVALSTIAFARQIGKIVALSSAESELLGLPDLTSACVPD